MHVTIFILMTGWFVTFILAMIVIIYLMEKIKSLETRNEQLRNELRSTLTELVSFKTLHSYKDVK
jgi:Tfp pilus assembly protein PilO